MGMMNRVKLNGVEWNKYIKRENKIKILLEAKESNNIKQREKITKWPNQRTQLTRTKSPSLTDKESRNPERISTSPLRV